MQERCDGYMCVVQPPDPQTTSPLSSVCLFVVLECTLCQQKTGGVPTLPRVFLLLPPLPTGSCRAAPTVCTMILKGAELEGGGVRSVGPVRAHLGTERVGMSSLSVSVPQCGKVCRSVRGGVPLWDGMSHCGKVCGMCVCVCVHVCVSLPHVLTVAELIIDIAFPISTS